MSERSKGRKGNWRDAISGKAIRYLFVITIAFVFYNGVSRLWIGANDWGIHQFAFEFPLYLAFMGLLYFPQIRSPLIREGLPPLSFLLIYVLFDLAYARLHRAPDASDLESIPLIFDFSLANGLLALAFLGIIPGLVVVHFCLAAKYSDTDHARKLVRWRIPGVIGFLLFLATPAIPWIQQYTFAERPWSQERSIRFNGRVSYFLFNEFKKRNLESTLASSLGTADDAIEKLFPGTIPEPRNIHLIILESFLDPRRIEAISYKPNPVGKELFPFLNDGQFSLARSPVFGGGTAQAEFEILTGIPALRRFTTPDFNVLRGADAGGFVSRLRRDGYHSCGTIASGREYYNAVIAYQSLGLDSVQFPDDEGAPRRAPGDHYIFDGDLFSHHLAKIEKMREEGQGPVISYLLGMYGHYPYHRNRKLRPDTIQLDNGTEKTSRMTNQFFYRSRALGIFLERLFASDPDSLVCIASDHLPLIDEQYLATLDKHVNSVLLLDRGEFVEVSGRPYYEIPWVIWDRLVGENPERHISALLLEGFYFEAIRRSRREAAGTEQRE